MGALYLGERDQIGDCSLAIAMEIKISLVQVRAP